MNSIGKLEQATKFLFSRDFHKELSREIVLTEEEAEVYEDCVKASIQEFGWPQVFDSWNRYLRTKCCDAESALNFANLFWMYGGHERSIPDPYDFLAWFYYQIDMKIYAEDAITILDGIAIEMLTRAGIRGVDWVENPYYAPEADPKILAAVQRLVDSNGSKEVL